MPIFADTILPFDLGLKRYEKPAERALRLKREQEAQRAAEQQAAERRRIEIEQRNAQARLFEQQNGLSNLSALQLAALIKSLESQTLTPNETALLAATRLALFRRFPNNPDLPFNLLTRPGVRVPLIATTATATGTNIYTTEGAVGVIAAAGAIGATIAPAKDGGTVGWNASTAGTAAGAVVAGLLIAAQLNSANPGDP